MFAIDRPVFLYCSVVFASPVQKVKLFVGRWPDLSSFFLSSIDPINRSHSQSGNKSSKEISSRSFLVSAISTNSSVKPLPENSLNLTLLYPFTHLERSSSSFSAEIPVLRFLNLHSASMAYFSLPSTASATMSISDVSSPVHPHHLPIFLQRNLLLI